MTRDVIGLGSMGASMTERLVRAGHRVDRMFSCG